MRLNEQWDCKPETHSFQRIEGILALEKSRVVKATPEDEVVVGDYVSWYELPNNKLLLMRDPNGVRVGKISSAHYHLEVDVTVEEQ